MFNGAKIGDLVNDCTSINGRVLCVEPEYWRVGHGVVLSDLDMQTSNTGASFNHCGIEHPKQVGEIEAAIDRWKIYCAENKADWSDRYDKARLRSDGTMDWQTSQYTEDVAKEDRARLQKEIDQYGGLFNWAMWSTGKEK